MASMFHRGDEWRDFWDYQFKWTPRHFTAEETRPMMHTYDRLASEALDRLDEISPSAPRPVPLEKEDASSHKLKPTRDLYEVLRDNADCDETLGRLWTQVNTIPEWVDWAQIERGQKVFLRYAGPAVFALTFQSLVGGMGSRRVVETLSRTGGFGVRVTRKRLLETFQHILQVTRDLESVKPGGEGFASSIRVRLLHATVRRRILALARERPGYYDVESLGIPINDLDCIGTISTFSSNLLWIGFPRQGIFLSRQEKVDYIALWRWVAYIMGSPTDPFATPEQAKAMMESLLVSEIQPSDTSRMLANNVLTGMSDQPPAYVSREFLAAETYWLNGSKLSKALAIDRPSYFYSALVFGQCLFFMFMCYTHKFVPSWDDARNKRTQTALFNLTIHKPELGALGRETNFEFQYIPSLAVAPASDEVDTAQLKPAQARDLERRNLRALVLAGALAGAVAWLGVRSASALFQNVLG